VAVDVAVLTVAPPTGGRRTGCLAVLVEDVEGEDRRALPGRFLRQRQTVADCVTDALRVKAGLEVKARARLLRVFDDPGRDPRGWTLSLAHALVLPPARLQAATGTLVAIARDGSLSTGESLLFDHDEIVTEATVRMREQYELLPDPDGLLDRPFTMAELRATHEAVLDASLLKDTFRRRMESHLQPLLDADGDPVLRSDGGRPAQVYVRRQDLELSASARRRLLLPRA
jgi:ADP-ribose pyrophosphatase YjhB (NUDIX family)